ncbi:MAG: hypothetical protein A2139_04930 [Desulfobacca sp. RBG_16_60_12]|nr:MAG: hypothetical protein A2139_04930 [Desulfobacca sp. RBG_16_60_12]
MALRYFIPDWDDRVDPGFDFITDEHTPHRVPYRDDVYAHEIFQPAPYDGVLLSRAVLDGNPAKRDAIREAGSVHRYLRLPIDGAHEVLGDCGAFTYWQQDTPPYDTGELLDFYQELGFDLGVSIDHLIFTEVEEEKERRWDITIENARHFIRLHRRGRYELTPIGVAQGWDPPSYRRAAHALVKMGYEYVAVGGLARSRTPDVVRVLESVQEELKPGTRVHLFGVNRPEHLGLFASLGVTSFDSASRLRRAWMDGRRNYFLGDRAHTAIRIPEARALARSMDLDETKAARLEQKALRQLTAYDRGEAPLKEVLRAVLAYSKLTGRLTEQTIVDYRETLESQPWKSCPCTICRTIGIEVVIFRGNNRNRRRGFHNTWQLYQQIRGIASTQEVPLDGGSQLTLGL